MPRTIEIELTEDICDSATPGDVITLSGVVRHSQIADKYAASTMYQLYVHALCVTNNKTKTRDSAELSDRSANIGIEFTLSDYSAIQEIHLMEGMIFKLLVHSICPSIYGHELVKAGLLLGLFGGSGKHQADRASVAVRGDPHVSERIFFNLFISTLIHFGCNVSQDPCGRGSRSWKVPNAECLRQHRSSRRICHRE